MLHQDPEVVLTDYAKFDKELPHCIYLALHEFQRLNKRMPTQGEGDKVSAPLLSAVSAGFRC